LKETKVEEEKFKGKKKPFKIREKKKRKRRRRKTKNIKNIINLGGGKKIGRRN
jgi:hypothetical protein